MTTSSHTRNEAHVGAAEASVDGLKPLLVLGLGRSGTTLTMQLLATSPRIAFDRVYPFEVRYLSYLQHWSLLLEAEPAPGTNWDTASVFAPPSALTGAMPYRDALLWDGARMRKRTLLAAWREFSEAASAKVEGGSEPPLYYAEKAPTWMPAVCRDLMPYRSIVIVRDPRDVLASVRAFDEKRGFAGFGFSRRPGESDEGQSLRFIDVCRSRLPLIRQELETADAILLKYEELVTDIDDRTSTLGEKLGVALDARRALNDAEAYGHHVSSRSVPESIGRWRKELDARSAGLLSRELRDDLQFFGYDD